MPVGGRQRHVRDDPVEGQLGPHAVEQRPAPPSERTARRDHGGADQDARHLRLGVALGSTLAIAGPNAQVESTGAARHPRDDLNPAIRGERGCRRHRDGPVARPHGERDAPERVEPERVEPDRPPRRVLRARQGDLRTAITVSRTGRGIATETVSPPGPSIDTWSIRT